MDIANQIRSNQILLVEDGSPTSAMCVLCKKSTEGIKFCGDCGIKKGCPPQFKNQNHVMKGCQYVVDNSANLGTWFPLDGQLLQFVLTNVEVTRAKKHLAVKTIENSLRMYRKAQRRHNNDDLIDFPKAYDWIASGFEAVLACKHYRIQKSSHGTNDRSFGDDFVPLVPPVPSKTSSTSSSSTTSLNPHPPKPKVKTDMDIDMVTQESQHVACVPMPTEYYDAYTDQAIERVLEDLSAVASSFTTLPDLDRHKFFRGSIIWQVRRKGNVRANTKLSRARDTLTAVLKFIKFMPADVFASRFPNLTIDKAYTKV